MFIVKSKNINFSNIYVCGEQIGNFLIEEGFPLLGREGKKMKFAKTERLEKVLLHLPAKLKLLRKVGLIDG